MASYPPVKTINESQFRFQKLGEDQALKSAVQEKLDLAKTKPICSEPLCTRVARKGGLCQWCQEGNRSNVCLCIRNYCRINTFFKKEYPTASHFLNLPKAAHHARTSDVFSQPELEVYFKLHGNKCPFSGRLLFDVPEGIKATKQNVWAFPIMVDQSKPPRIDNVIFVHTKQAAILRRLFNLQPPEGHKVHQKMHVMVGETVEEFKRLLPEWTNTKKLNLLADIGGLTPPHQHSITATEKASPKKKRERTKPYSRK